MQGSGGKLSKNLQAQNKLKPGQETENSVERVIVSKKKRVNEMLGRSLVLIVSPQWD